MAAQLLLNSGTASAFEDAESDWRQAIAVAVRVVSQFVEWPGEFRQVNQGEPEAWFRVQTVMQHYMKVNE